MSEALNGDQRTALNALVQKGRSLLEADLFTTLEGEYGIHRSDGRIEDIAALSLDTRRSAVRADLLDVISFLRSEGETARAAVDRLVREAAFTHLNRFIALRVAEGLGIMQEAIADGISSLGFRDFIEIAPASADEDWERFRLFLRICADELSTDVPALFDPRNPLLDLEPTTATFAELINLIAGSDEDIWTAPDALGWSYQFFNSGDERREMRESSAPRNSRELAVRNQFFTPSYVVEFLVQNGLGAHLSSAIPGLGDELPLLLEVPEVSGSIDLEDVSALDPACGSGHFLLGAYDVLETAWQHAGVDPDKAAPSIVASLWGIDIDPRATQIAQAAVIFRARRHCRTELPRPHIICARALPHGPSANALTDELPEHVARVVRAIAEELTLAPVLGPLLQIEKRLETETRDIFGTGEVAGSLSEGADKDVADDIRGQVLEALSTIADSTTSSASERLFAAEAQDSVRFVEAMSRKFTAVLMNPPFGEPVPETKKYLKAAYPWAPTKDCNLLALFVGRGLDLSETGHGTCGAITSRAGFFLKTSEDWRENVLLGNRLTSVVDLGYGVMEQALVEAAAYVVRNAAPHGSATFIRLLKETDRPIGLRDAASARRSERPDERVFEVELRDLRAIPGSPLAYWAGDSIRRLFEQLPALEGSGGNARQGLASADDFQFVRAFWEVAPERIGHSTEDARRSRRWVPFAKGGAYSPFWSDVHLLVDWQDGGEHLKAFAGSVIRNPQFYFRGGLTWPPRTNSGLGMRLLPSGVAFAHKGCGVFPLEGSTLALLGWLRSRLVQALIDTMVAAGEEVSSGGASRSYEVGLVQKLPWLNVPALAPIAERLARRASVADEFDEVTRRFVQPRQNLALRRLRIGKQLEDGAELDQVALDAAGLDAAGRQYLDEELGAFPTQYPMTGDHDDRIEDLWTRPIGDVIDELIEESGGSRAIANLTFVADRRVEVIAHGLKVNPESILRVVEERAIIAPGEIEEESARLLSYLFGVAFGRWDVRIGIDSDTAHRQADLMAPPAPYSPGMLLGADGRPMTNPDDYPVDLPADGLLLDQAGHEWDVASRVGAAAEAMFGGREELSAAISGLMRRPSVEGYYRSAFFKDHLSRYSMSRRKAPIYWQLQVPSKQWGIWLYMPRLSREMLFAVVRATEERQRLADQRIGTLQREYDDGGAGRTTAAVLKELNAEQDLSVELTSFRDEADRIANLGWQPDLDDGAVLNAAPLASLFPAWKDAAKYRNELLKGKHDWATVAQFANQL
ncbi:MAG: Eco57I restriction-modification methylase domain-containing protein [Ilumatobacter sp.]|uniref:Eco57I restriction-modification methylase domain-containing protein n=1 Tax=Ilumatobacter sp. TaxID=1967498 RepID=UPI00391C7C4A